MKKLPYSEGTVFLVPLKTGGYARGVVARTSKKGRVLLGYFFGPRLKSRTDVQLDDLEPSAALLCVRFGDLGLINGEWPIIQKIPDWNRLQWPIPRFICREILFKEKAWVIEYSDEDPNEIVSRYPTDYNSQLASDELYGYGAVEIALTDILGEVPVIGEK